MHSLRFPNRLNLLLGEQTSGIPCLGFPTNPRRKTYVDWTGADILGEETTANCAVYGSLVMYGTCLIVAVEFSAQTRTTIIMIICNLHAGHCSLAYSRAQELSNVGMDGSNFYFANDVQLSAIRWAIRQQQQ